MLLMIIEHIIIIIIIDGNYPSWIRSDMMQRPGAAFRVSMSLGCAYLSTQGGGASHDGFGVLVSTTFPLFQNHTFAHDLPPPLTGGKKSTSESSSSPTPTRAPENQFRQMQD